jgi:hypothetical protein
VATPLQLRIDPLQVPVQPQILQNDLGSML